MRTTKYLTRIIFSFLLIVFIAGCGGSGGSDSMVINSAANGGGSTSAVNDSGDGGGTALKGVASLIWDAPLNADGTLFTGFAGYKVYYGTSPGLYSHFVNVGMITNYSINNLSPGTYYFAVTVYDTSGNESGYSDEKSKTIL